MLLYFFFKASPISIVKTGETWSVNSHPGDDNFVKQLIMSMSELSADSFPVDNRDYGFSNPRLKAVVRLQQPEADKKIVERTIVVGDNADRGSNDENRYFAAVDDMSEPFIISKESYKDIFPRLEILLRAKDAPTVAPETSGSPAR